MIELTEEQERVMDEEKAPLHVLNPRTQEVFVLSAKTSTNSPAAWWAAGRAKSGTMRTKTLSKGNQEQRCLKQVLDTP